MLSGRVEDPRIGGACSVVKCYTQHASQVIHSSIPVRDLHALTHPRKHARRKKTEDLEHRLIKKCMLYLNIEWVRSVYKKSAIDQRKLAFQSDIPTI